jgi:predicted Rossmann fold flavoprotein
MFAGAAAGRGKRICILEHNNAAGKKILISGGGRANFTNLRAGATNYISANPHFAKSALAQFGPLDFIEFAERGGLRWQEKKSGQLFCAGSARDLLNLLLDECGRSGVDLRLNAPIARVERQAGAFRITTSEGSIEAGAVVVATGGLSIPRLGATGFGYELARQFGLRIVNPRPALVPLLLGGDEARWTQLAGLSTKVTARAGRHEFSEKMLFTHRGLSGPAILQASSYLNPGETLEIDFLAACNPAVFGSLPGSLHRDERAVRALLSSYMPQRLAEALAAHCGGFSNAALQTFEHRLRRWMFHPAGNEGYGKAEVTAGGVDTRDLDSRTLAARSIPGLYFIGEVVDVTGQLGGFNFQWAWSSAVAAARSL